MKNKDRRFIKTKDKDTAFLLMQEGFDFINECDGFFTFVNCKKIESFSETNKKNIIFSDILCF